MSRGRVDENETGVAAWQSEIVRSAPTWLAQALASRVTELAPRISRCHTELRTLPRRTRRAWQRQLARSSSLTAILDEWSQRRVGRSLQKQLARTLAGAALLLALTQGIAQAGQITVNTTNPNVVDGDGKCSLIEAIETFNGTAHADCPIVGGGANTIALLKGTHTLSAVDNTTYFGTGTPVITSAITIEGNGAKITRKSSAPPFRLIAVGATGDLTLKNLTLTGGQAEYYGGAIYNAGLLTIQNSTISGNAALVAGGGISNYSSATPTSLTIQNSIITGNTVGKGYFAGFGGGIDNYLGKASIVNSTISRNKSVGILANFGAGIHNDDEMTIDGSTVSANRATGLAGDGGGIVSYGNLTITNSTISGNKASGKSSNVAGGIDNLGTMQILKSTISGNSAGSAYAYGGGIANGGDLTVENSTISGNKASGRYGTGGGIFNAGASATLTARNSTITGNKASPQFYGGGGIYTADGSMELHTTLISGNKGKNGPEVYLFSGTSTVDDVNLFGVNGVPGVFGFSPGATDIVPAAGVKLADIIGPLKSNGGPTKTHLVQPGSPALDAVPSGNGSCTGTDQRGIDRPQPTGGNCDIGATERSPADDL